MEETEEEISDEQEETPKVSVRKIQFENKINDLQVKLNRVNSYLEEQEALLDDLKKRLTEEQGSKEACVAHLKRVLRSKIEECIEVQNEMQLIKDLAELSEHRSTSLNKNVDRNYKVSKNIYLQQKRELEGKLSALEEKRIQKNKQLHHLKRLEDAVKEKEASKRNQDKEKSEILVSLFLEKRRKFEKMVESLCSNACDAFDLKLPVYAKEQLRDNVRLRKLYRDTSEGILTEQDHSRRMKNMEDSLCVEMDILNRTAAVNSIKKAKLEKQLESLVQEISYHDNDSTSSSDNVDKKIVLEYKKDKLCKMVDLLVDLTRILEDQDEYKQLLEKSLKEKIDDNGEKLSAILRAGRMIRSRIEDVTEKEETYLDIKLLKQIQTLLKEETF